MLCISKMQTVKGRVVGDEAVIGKLVRYKNRANSLAQRARIAFLDSDSYDFDMLFEISQEFMGFVRFGEFDKEMAEMAEELRLVGLFCEDEKRLFAAMNEMVIILPKKNRAILAPDIRALKNFESTLLVDRELDEDLTPDRFIFSGKYKKELNKIKKYF